ncbi:MAG: cob(I)yrinic acid a,c-diamide adenosyltransferase [Fibrobacterota bacterium]|nr:cob(I)yrinic acid a,c-diamide adenosyltransferase [Chitinispirillaceae bacterium]
MKRIIVITGDGKGKSTSAFGTALRAAGHGMRVSIIQFIKGNADIGELVSLAKIPLIDILQCGLGFVIHPDREEHLRHQKAALDGLAIARSKLTDTSVGMVILDEICAAINSRLLGISDVLHAIESAHDTMIIICTGRNAPKELIDIADTVSEIACIKHGFSRGIKAQVGVEM